MKLSKETNFIGCDCDFEDSLLTIAGIPYDGTSSFRPGSRFAPDSIRKASYSIETFSPDSMLDIEDFKVSDIGNLEFPYGNREEVLCQTENLALHILKNKKKAIFIGGEHLLSYPLIKKYKEKFKDLKVIYFDAHADMRDSYLDDKLSHACAARRITEIVGKENIFMFGIRSFEKNEFNFIRNNNIFCDSKCEQIWNVIETIKSFPVYISLDLDVFDPACLPGLGTPEAGGIFYNDFIEIMEGLSEIKYLVSADVVELSPDYDPTGNSSVFTAKIIRELILRLI